MLGDPEIHPSFPQPTDTGQMIWRYMDFDKFEWMLDHGRLFMPTAENLGDPLEGSTPSGYVAWWQREIDNATSEENRSIITHNRRFASRTAALFRNRYYVSCWHANTHENYLMWRSYTKTREAVAVRTTYSALRSALPGEAFMGVVRYIDYSTDGLPWGNMFEYITHKDIAYRAEAEVRAVVAAPLSQEVGLDRFLADHFCLTANPEFHLYAPRIDVTTLIQGVILHPEAPADFVAKVRDSCEAKGLPAPALSRQTTKPVY
jgi:hypothetical protein